MKQTQANIRLMSESPIPRRAIRGELTNNWRIGNRLNKKNDLLSLIIKERNNNQIKMKVPNDLNDEGMLYK
jgi:hypothetical protein